MSTHSALILPRWPAPDRVRAISTTRLGGVSLPPFHSLNLGDHVGDDPVHVSENRHRLQQLAQLPEAPRWLSQVHGCRIMDADNWQPGVEADAITSIQAGQVCPVLTADCLPVLLCDREGKRIAAIHAGWRGLLNGIIEQAVARFDASGPAVLAWLGPAIGPGRFEVGTEVCQAFVDYDSAAMQAFIQTDDCHFLADLYLLARQRLAAAGVAQVFGGDFCTASDPDRFFSYRRDQRCGRMASVIWIAAE